MPTSKDHSGVRYLFCPMVKLADRTLWPHKSRSGPVIYCLRPSSGYVRPTRHRGKAKGSLGEPGVMSFPCEIMQKSERHEFFMSLAKSRISTKRVTMVYFQIGKTTTGVKLQDGAIRGQEWQIKRSLRNGAGQGQDEPEQR